MIIRQRLPNPSDHYHHRQLRRTNDYEDGGEDDAYGSVVKAKTNFQLTNQAGLFLPSYRCTGRISRVGGNGCGGQKEYGTATSPRIVIAVVCKPWTSLQAPHHFGRTLTDIDVVRYGQPPNLQGWTWLNCSMTSSQTTWNGSMK